MTAKLPRSVVAIVLGYLLSVAFYSRLPGPYLRNVPSPTAVRLLIAFTGPTTAGVIYWLLRQLWRRDSIRCDDSMVEATTEKILFQIILFVMMLHALVITELVGIKSVRASAGRIVLVLAGLVLAGVGNLLPRTRPNLVFGIRTRHTLVDRRTWIELHRVGGYASVGLGIVIAFAGAFLPGPMMPLVVVPAGLVAAGTVVASHWRSSRV